mgnify:CR=1 FL=1
MNTIQKINQLSEYQAQRDYLAMQKAELLAAVIPPELRTQVEARTAEIEAEFAPKLEAVDANIAALTDEVKAEVIAGGESVKGDHLHAVYIKGRVSWDSKKLDGLMIAIPELAAARKEGEPSVTIRKI